VSQRDILQFRKQHHLDIAGIKVMIRFADGRTYDQAGAITFVDVLVDRPTDTITVRATFPNPHLALVDGELVRVTLQSVNPAQEIVIPEAALLEDQDGVYVFTVDNGKAVVKRVKTGGASGTGFVVTSGLSGGEQVIVDGIQNVRPAAAVQAHSAQSLNTN
jgi:membrane fusion protein (multidrug efflux system)